ncbi:amine-terminal domain cyclin (macronuclear) [Tetrahymena thermophila SB210]|uniref:Amine-terminal domain cyclin n=1 Tax=Tetrahymena thermophila (strain SB210) TaxID=312017 RepID=Q24F73_TETTS|nr:amine-terminal domain cyclin [Tetrahymena thermophila SB210]EAS06402.2 amine-terminal domain cyclin [Tetrahymena thermophila SB210]|eukprot:XP_001026647.2 amine-terminal domain cyclin [Tetrahymena thermophila SB210]
MQKDSSQIGDQFLLSLGSLTQSVPTNISAMSNCSSGQQFVSHSNTLLKVQSLEATSPTAVAAVGFQSQSQNTEAVIKSGELKSVMSSDNLLNLAPSTQSQAPPQAPFTLTSSTSVTISSIGTQIQSLTTQIPSNMLYTYFNCKHQAIVTYSKCQFCKECGVRMYKNGQMLALKSQQMNYKLNTNPLRLYSNTYKQKKQKNTINFQEHQDYLKQRERTINYVIDLADRMRLSKQTAFLSIMFLDYLVANDTNSELCTFKIKDHLQIFGAVCVMLAAKSIELDERIPFLSSLKKYMCLNQYSKEDLRKAEQKTVQILKFNMQFPTLYDLLEYYGSQGVVFSNDLQKGTTFTSILSPTPFLSNETKNTSAKKERFINNRTIELEFQGTAPSSSAQNQQQSEDSTKNSSPNSNDYSSTQETSSKNSNSDEANPSCSPPPHSKIVEPQPQVVKEFDISPIKLYDIVSKIEKDFSRIAFLAIKDEKFYEQDLEILGAACICYLREKQNISNPYRDEILQICSQDRAQVLSCCLTFLSKFDTYFKPHSYLNGSTSSGISPLKDIRTNLKQGFYTSDNYKSASNLTTTATTRILQENKKPLFDNIDLNSYRIREKSFEKIGISYQSQRSSIASQHVSKNTISGLQNNRNNFFEYAKLNEQKINNLSSITNISTSNASSTSQAAANSGIASSSNQILQSGSLTSTSSNINSLQSKLLQQQNAFSSGAFHSSSSSSNALSSGLSSISSYQKPYQLALNQYSSKPLLSTTTSTVNSKIPQSIPNFDDEAKWNSHFTKTINSINFRASSFNSNSFLRRNKF